MTKGLYDFCVTIGARFLCLFVAIGTQCCLAWILGPGGRGSYAVSLLFASLLGVVLGVGGHVASVYFVSSKRFSLSEGVVYAFVFVGISSGLAISAGLLLMQLPWSFFRQASPTAFYIGLASIPTSMLALILPTLLSAVRQFGLFAVVLVGNACSQAVLVLLFVWILAWDVEGALVALVSSNLVTIVGTLILMRWKHGITWVRPSFDGRRQMFSYSLRFHAGKISNTVNFQVGTLVLALVASKEQVGLFAVALQLTTRAMMIPDVLTTVLIPRVAGDKAEGERLLVARCARMTALTCGVLLLGLAVLAEPIIAVLFSPAFLPAVALVQILAAGAFVRCASKVYVPYFLGTDHPGIAAASVAVGTVVNVGMAIVLLPVFGLPGLALATTLGYFVSATLLTLSFNRYSGLTLAQMCRVTRSDWSTLSGLIRRDSSRNGRVPQ